MTGHVWGRSRGGLVSHTYTCSACTKKITFEALTNDPTLGVEDCPGPKATAAERQQEETKNDLWDAIVNTAGGSAR